MVKQLVSVVIPCYNAMPYLKETLDSVTNQTYTNIEIIVVDDGSEDGSFEYVKGLNYPNLYLKKNKGKGACAARNFGMELAKGDFIQFLDADDLLAINKIEAQMQLVQEYGDDFVFSCKWIRFWDYLEPGSQKPQNIDKDYAYPHLWLRDSWLGGGMGQTSVWLTSIKLIKKAGVWDESLSLNQDGEFFCRVLLQSKGIKFCDATEVYYRSGNPNSISQGNKSYKKAQSLLKSYSLYKKHIVKYNHLPELREALATNFLMFIYQYYGTYEDLCNLAETEFKELGYENMWPVGGQKFKTLARRIGFKNVLKLRRFIKQLRLK